MTACVQHPWVSTQSPGLVKKAALQLTKFSLLKRRVGLTREAFVQHWTTVHANVLVNQAGHKHYNQRYVQNRFLDVEGFNDASFDGAAQMIPQSVQVLQHGFQEDPLYQQLVRPDELLFLDVPSCQVLYCERRPIQAVAPGQAGLKAFILVRRQAETSRTDFLKTWLERAQTLVLREPSLCGVVQHHVMQDAARGMADGVPCRQPFDLVEELFFHDLNTLRRVTASVTFGEDFASHGARPTGQGSLVFAAQEHLVYDDTDVTN
jgi:hypothetical protein